MVITNDYFLPLRPRITFKSIDDVTTYFTFDAFEETNPFVVTGLDVEGAVGESGTFSIIVNDVNNVIDETGLRSAKIYIELGKAQDNMHFFMIGFGDIFSIDRPITNYQQYIVNGFGSAIRAGELFIHRRQASNITDIASTPNPIVDHNYDIYKLAISALTKTSWRPLKDHSIVDITGWSTSGISSAVNINFPVVNAPFTYLSDFLDQLCSVSGAVWFIDFATGAEVFTLTYNTALSTGVTIKSGDLKVVATDDPTRTGYIKRAFNVEDNATTSAGVATRLYTTTTIDRQIITQSTSSVGWKTINNKAIAQQFIIDNDQRRLDSLALVLHKIGDPASPKDRINGEIFMDNGANKPTGTSIGTFKIPLSSIEVDKQSVLVNDLDIKERFLTSGQTKLWIVLYQRSGTNGDPQDDPSNTIAWHNNNQFSTLQTTYSAEAPIGERDTNLSWSSTNQGPTYSFQVMSNIRRLQARTNQQAAAVLRMREQFIPTAFLSDPLMVNRFLSLNLSQMSKPRRTIQEYQVTIPNNFIYKPYQFVTFVDGLSDIAQELQIKRVRYTMNTGNSGDSPLGALHADIAVGGSYNTILGDCSCS